MLKIKAYDLVYAKDIDSLKKEMTQILKNGWYPLGGIAIGGSPADPRFYQSIVLYEN
jgi:hypothetical protein